MISRALTLSRTYMFPTLFEGVIFLYFITLSADLLNVEIGLFKAKLNHLLALLLGISVLASKKVLVIERKIVQSFFVILVSLALSMFLSSYFERCLGYLCIYLFYFLFYFIIPFNLVLHEESSKIFKLYGFSFACVGVFAFLQLALSLLGIDPPYVQQKIQEIARPNGFSYEPSYYALYMTIFVMWWNAKKLLAPTFFLGKRDVLRFLLVNGLLLLSTATSAFFSYFVFAFVFLVFPLKDFPWAKRNFLKVSLVFTICFLIPAAIFWSFYLTTFFKFFTFEFYLHHSFAERWESIKNCFQIFLSHPFFGVGLGGISPLLFQEGKGQSSSYDLEEISIFEPSNMFTEMLASLGVVGFFSFLFLSYAFFSKFLQVVRNPFINKEEKKLATAFFLSLITIILALQFNQGLFRGYIWVHAALTYGYLQRLSNTNRVPSM